MPPDTRRTAGHQPNPIFERNRLAYDAAGHVIPDPDAAVRKPSGTTPPPQPASAGSRRAAGRGTGHWTDRADVGPLSAVTSGYGSHRLTSGHGPRGPTRVPARIVPVMLPNQAAMRRRCPTGIRSTNCRSSLPLGETR